jgi:para-aminobenzoate synthetase / 4-amino-4-deoxychorismate lyase
MSRPHQPDPRRGVFETLLVRGGEPVALDAHLARLARSLEALYGQQLPAGAASEAERAAADVELGRLRLAAVPREAATDGAPLALEVSVDAVDPAIVFPDCGPRLRTQPTPGGLGPHKWVDRPAVDRPVDGVGPLLTDGREVLEAGWANVFAVMVGTLWTPPLDGRILPGTTRAAILALAAEEGIDARQGVLSADDLLAAEEVFLTGSVRGIEVATELDGVPLAGAGAISRRLAAALRRRWRVPARRAGAPVP